MKDLWQKRKNFRFRNKNNSCYGNKVTSNLIRYGFCDDYRQLASSSSYDSTLTRSRLKFLASSLYVSLPKVTCVLSVIFLVLLRNSREVPPRYYILKLVEPRGIRKNVIKLKKLGFVRKRCFILPTID